MYDLETKTMTTTTYLLTDNGTVEYPGISSVEMAWYIHARHHAYQNPGDQNVHALWMEKSDD